MVSVLPWWFGSDAAASLSTSASATFKCGCFCIAAKSSCGSFFSRQTCASGLILDSTSPFVAIYWELSRRNIIVSVVADGMVDVDF